MNSVKVVKALPTLLLIGFLAYSSLAIQSELPDAGAKQAEIEKGLDRMLQDMVAAGSAAAVKVEGQLRDPFRVIERVPAAADLTVQQVTSPESDPMGEIVRGLSLEATLLQGRDQIAVINGRIYSKGQRLELPDTDGTDLDPLVVLAVNKGGVILRGGGRNYRLGYPDRLVARKREEGGSAKDRDGPPAELDPAGQAAMFQRLLNSPLGAMGRGLIGDAVTPPGSRKRGRGGAGAGGP